MLLESIEILLLSSLSTDPDAGVPNNAAQRHERYAASVQSAWRPPGCPELPKVFVAFTALPLCPARVVGQVVPRGQALDVPVRFHLHFEETARPALPALSALPTNWPHSISPSLATRSPAERTHPKCCVARLCELCQACGAPGLL